MSELKEFNQESHPEIRCGEIFHSNTANKTASQVKINSKRVGVVAYDKQGNTVKGLVPVFISNKDECLLLISEFKKLQAKFDFFSGERKLCFRAIRLLRLLENKGCGG